MRARYYYPTLMRFINEDIVTGDISNSNSLNRYAYVEGNPVTLIDPFGLCVKKKSENMHIARGPLTTVEKISLVFRFFAGTNKLIKYSAEEEVADLLGAEASRKLAHGYAKVADFFDYSGSSLKQASKNLYNKVSSPSPYMGMAPLGGAGGNFSYNYGAATVSQGVALDAFLIDVTHKMAQLIVADATNATGTLISFIGDSARETADHYNNRADSKSESDTKYGIDVNNLNFSNTVLGHSNRPYQDSK